MADEHYMQVIHEAEEKLLRFLQTFESIQENIDFGKIEYSQARLQETVGDLFATLPAQLAELSPPEMLAEFHTAFTAAIAQFSNASQAFLQPSGDFSVSFLNSRWALCRGMNLLYGIRAHLPTVQQYWFLPGTLPNRDALETLSPAADVPVGMLHNKRTAVHSDYSLYVPENYTPQKKWPLIVCLHGGYGRGDDYIWSWIRPAKSKGYLVLSPKSTDVTWSVLQPALDVGSITAMFEGVCETYAVDTRRVYLSGLSDGGTFTYLFGLTCPEMFAGIAPIAGDFHPMMDAMLHQKQGKDLPIYIVHGAHDFIFKVESIRQGHELLSNIGYKATYRELPDWGHAYTSSINEELVLPWFEALAAKA